MLRLMEFRFSKKISILRLGNFSEEIIIDRLLLPRGLSERLFLFCGELSLLILVIMKDSI